MRNLLIGILLLGVAGYFGIKWKMHNDVETGLDAMLLTMSPFAQIEYEGISSTLTGELTVDGVRGRISGFSDVFHIDRIGIDTPSFLSLMRLSDFDGPFRADAGKLPENVGLIVRGLRMPVNADFAAFLYEARLAELGDVDLSDPAAECTGRYGLSPSALTAMGYKEYNLSMSAHLRQETGNYALNVSTQNENMWDLDAELVLAGNILAEFARGPALRPKLQSMQLVYTDRSLRDRIVEHCRRLGLDDEQIVAAQFDTFMALGTENGIEFDEYMTAPYRDFLDGKSTLVVTATPNEPVALSQLALYKPSDVPALLQLSAEVR